MERIQAPWVGQPEDEEKMSYDDWFDKFCEDRSEGWEDEEER